MRRKKWLIGGGLLVAVLTALVAFSPAPRSGFEPEWLLKIKPESEKRLVFNTSGPRVGSRLLPYDLVVFSKRREFKQPIREVVAKLDASLTPQDGWTIAHRSEGQVIWTKNIAMSKEGFSVSIVTMGDPCTLDTAHSRPLSWLEKTQRSIRRFFGLEKK